jgi:hypothetical protein
MTYIIKPKTTKTSKTLKARKPRKCVNKRVFPAWREGMPTSVYIDAYHAANASVHLTMVDYICN